MEISRNEKSVRLVLPSVLGLGESEDLLAALRNLHGEEAPYAIDGSAVARINTPCLQVLLCALLSREGTALTAPSLPMLAVIDELGMTEHFEERMVLE